MMVKKKVVIEGEKVHYVGYRPFLLAKARRLRIPNYEADNIEEDGKEKVIVSVGGEEKQVLEFVEFIKRNYPTKAKVSNIREAEAPEWVMPIDEYDKVLAAEQQSTIVQSGLGMLEKQDQTIDLQRQTLEKQDQTIDLQRQTLEKQDQTIDLQRQTIGAIDKLDADVNMRFDNLDVKYGKIAENMERILEEMKEERKEARKSMERILNAILKLVKKTG